MNDFTLWVALSDWGGFPSFQQLFQTISSSPCACPQQALLSMDVLRTHTFLHLFIFLSIQLGFDGLFRLPPISMLSSLPILLSLTRVHLNVKSTLLPTCTKTTSTAGVNTISKRIGSAVKSRSPAPPGPSMLPGDPSMPPQPVRPSILLSSYFRLAFCSSFPPYCPPSSADDREIRSPSKRRRSLMSTRSLNPPVLPIFPLLILQIPHGQLSWPPALHP